MTQPSREKIVVGQLLMGLAFVFILVFFGDLVRMLVMWARYGGDHTIRLDNLLALWSPATLDAIAAMVWVGVRGFLQFCLRSPLWFAALLAAIAVGWATSKLDL